MALGASTATVVSDVFENTSQVHIMLEDYFLDAFQRPMKSPFGTKFSNRA